MFVQIEQQIDYANNFLPLRYYSLHRGRSKRLIVRVVPDRSTGLYRIQWPDIELSDLLNLTRAKATARDWAERKAVIEDRKLPVARRLKSLDNFWWSASLVRQTAEAAE